MRLNLKFYNHKKNKIIQYASVDLNSKVFKHIFFNFINLTKNKTFKSFVFNGKNLILTEAHELFYYHKYNLEYTSSIFKDHKIIKKYINLDYAYNYNENEIFFYDYYKRKNYKNIIEHLSIAINCKLYEVFLEKESNGQKTTCIPGITTSKLIYNPNESNSFR
tara:strand:- start:2325 stop:2813 length:489 start_codon:yes stop_codon:yes gene_type:complete